MRVVQLHLVAERPAKKRRMVLVLPHHIQDLTLRIVERLLVCIVEAMLGMAKPVAGHHGKPVLLRLVELVVKIVRTPGAERIGPALGEQFLGGASARSENEIRLPVAFEMPVSGSADDADTSKGCHRRHDTC